MRVFLFNPQTQLYYAKRNQWVAARFQARDFQSVGRAAQLAADRKFGSVEVVLDLESPVSEVALPLSFARRMERAQFVVSAIAPACLPAVGATQQRAHLQA